MISYLEFLNAKRHTSNDFGIKPNYLPNFLFDFQSHVAEYSIKKGRCANFIDTGLGKTIIEMVTAVNYVRSTNKRVLIITPLAVALQFLDEANKFGIDDISYSRDGKLTTKIIICNYERLSKFDPNDFQCVILDESSILKNFQGAIKGQITAFLKKVKYRFLFTATPSPNDFIELGTSSEALGYLGYTDMLTKFFTNNEDTVSPQNIGTEWILKGHARKDFFRWVSSWSISMRKPSDLGFNDTKFILPDLLINDHSIKNDKNLVINGQVQLFNRVARTRTEIAQETRLTIDKRCEKAVELASQYETSVYWVNLNPEGDFIQHLDKDAYQISGSMPLDKKEEILMAFQKGEIKKLITKAKMTAFGLNWQHCNHTVYFPSFSYEQWYQAIRRFWRFGQKRQVIADRIYSDGMVRIIDSLSAKTQKANELFSELNAETNTDYVIENKEFNQKLSLPKFA